MIRHRKCPTETIFPYKANNTNRNERIVLSRRKPSFGMFRRMTLVGTDVSEEHIAPTIRVARIGDLGTIAVTSN
jgi:hypothetical protein